MQGNIIGTTTKINTNIKRKAVVEQRNYLKFN